MSKEFLNYLKYIGFIDDNTIQVFISIFNSIIELDNNKKNNKENIITSMIQYLKNLTDEQIKEIMTKMYEKYNENKNKLESKNLVNLLKIYKNKEIKFYFVYWYKLSQYLMHKDIQKYQNQFLTITNDKKNINNSNFIKGNYLDAMTVNNNTNNKNNFIPNNISMIKVRNSENCSHNYTYKPKIPKSNFIERQEKYTLLKKERLLKNIDNNEEEFQLLYTFKPCLEESKKYYYSNNYNGGALREMKKNRNINLYSNKIHEIKMKNLRETIDNERGLTFKPRINSYKNVVNMYKKNHFDL